jgi:hypothetical protein
MGVEIPIIEYKRNVNKKQKMIKLKEVFSILLFLKNAKTIRTTNVMFSRTAGTNKKFFISHGQGRVKLFKIPNGIAFNTEKRFSSRKSILIALFTFISTDIRMKSCCFLTKIWIKSNEGFINPKIVANKANEMITTGYEIHLNLLVSEKYQPNMAGKKATNT